MIKFKKYFFVSFIILFLIIGCATSISISQNKNSSSPLLIGAAASLEPVLTKIDKLYSQKIDYTFASSGILQQQIEQGANIDIFISASNKQMDSLEKKDLLYPESRKKLVANQLVLITRKDNILTINDFAELTDDSIKLIAMGEPKSVPAGYYAQEVLNNLNIFSSLESKSKLLFNNNVRATLTSVETGNVDVGIVYLTDAKSSNQVKIIAIADANLHSPIIYPMAIIKDTKHLSEAEKYLQFLLTEEVQNIFVNYGFSHIQS